MEVTEGLAKIVVSNERKISKKLPVFYNPVMKHNRDISILLLNSIADTDLRIALPLSGSGIRGIRFLKELDKSKIKEIYFNDNKADFEKVLKKNLTLNKIKSKKIILSNTDANVFLLSSKGFDYIDIDPFGTPNAFLDAAVNRLSRNGILAVTATDTSALCGTYINSCRRKYWAVPLNNELKHEMGIRILIRKVQLVAAQYSKALIPIFSYSKDHYMRVFFRCFKGKAKTDEVIKQHGYFKDAGPLWLGKLWDSKLANKISESAGSELSSFLQTITAESKISAVGFFDIHTESKRHKLKKIPKITEVLKKIKKASRTHFSPYGIRTDITEKEFVRIIR